MGKKTSDILQSLSPYLTSIQASHNRINIQRITKISIKTTENNDDRGRQYQIAICFRDHGSLREFV